MRRRHKLLLPWDILVFLTVATAGLGLAIRNSFNPPLAEASITRETAAESGTIFDIGCLEKHTKESLILSQGSLRMKGKFCEEQFLTHKSSATMRIRNITNQTESTVFFHDPQSFFTAKIPLEWGKKNIIHLEWKAEGKIDSRNLVTEVLVK